MTTTITGAGFAASQLTGALPAIDGSSLTGARSRATASAQTTTNRTITYSTNWTAHQSISITTANIDNVRMSFTAASGYESGNVQAEFRFKCGSVYSDTMSLWNQFSSNKGYGSHGGVWEFSNISVGVVACEVQVRNIGSGSSIIMNNWDTEADTFMVNYAN